MKRYVTPFILLAMPLFATAPFLIQQAPLMQRMGYEGKIFFYHVPSAMMMFVSAFVCGIASAVFLFKSRDSADHVAEAAGALVIVFGLIVLVTGPIWGAKTWGHWWSWEPRLTLSLLLEMIFVAYWLVRKYGGPGAEKLSAAMALFGMATVPFVYFSVRFQSEAARLHPNTTVVPTLAPEMRPAFWLSVLAFLLLYIVLLTIRTGLSRAHAEIERVYLNLGEE
jgi:heme exporter protein C